MTQRHHHSSITQRVFLLLLSALPLVTSQAATTDLSQIPLYSLASVPPNIFFLNDDSDSMDYETLLDDTTNWGRLAKEDPAGYNYTATGITLDVKVHQLWGTCDFDPDGKNDKYAFILDTSGVNTCDDIADDVAAEEEWRVRFHEINPLYYNPNITYEPWYGTDPSTGNAFGNMTIDAARIDPIEASKGTINLLTESAVIFPSGSNTRTYYSDSAWTSWCSSHAPGTSCQGWRYYYRDVPYDPNSPIKLKWVVDLTDAEKTNFANWFTYHRSRKNVAKYAIGRATVNASGKRIGYGAINDIYKKTPSDIAFIADNNTGNVLNKLYNTFANGNTPLQSALYWAGRYFEKGEPADDGNSPILTAAQGGTCQLNSTVLITDGFYTDVLDSFNTSSAGAAVGNADNDGSPNYTAFDQGPYGDGFSRTLGDIAMHFYERDLATGLADAVKGKNKYQHMNTYTISMGLKGTITNTDSYDFDALNTANQTFPWPDPMPTGLAADKDKRKIDDLFHAAVNGRGHYFMVNDPKGLNDAINNIVSSQPVTSGSSNVAATSAFRLGPDGKVITTSFDSTHWSGTVKMLQLVNGVLDQNNPVWSTNVTLPLGIGSSRQIITYDQTKGGLPFTWTNLQGTFSDLEITYLRGDEVSNYRPRTTALGDIINSSPVYVGTPSLLYPDSDPFGSPSNRYSKFWLDNYNRKPIVYVGANDGMLHGFRINSDGTHDAGSELFAYVPNAIFSKLNALTQPAFDTNHQYFVDQTPTVSDVYTSTPLESAKWRTVLVSGLGAGERGLFALDITNPDNLNENNAGKVALWEFTNNNDPDLGYTLSKPVIAMTESNQWVVISSNGYGAESGDAALFILNLDADPSDGWTLGSEYTKIVTGDQTGNALFSPAAVDSDGNGKVDHVYAGDLQGNMWVFDLSNNTSRVLFTAKDSSGKAQPITSKPTVIRHPTQPTTSSNKPNMLVLFGTGKYLSYGDLTNSDGQSFYAVWDDGVSSNLLRDKLAAQSLTTGTDTTLNIGARLTQNIDVKYGATDTTKQYGWYLDFPNPGSAPSERVITGATVFQEYVFFTTYIPSSDPCNGGGDSWFMFLKTYNGGPPDEPIISINNDLLVEADKDIVNLDGTDKAPSGVKIEGGAFGLRFNQEEVIIGTTENANTNNTMKEFAHNLGTADKLGKRISWRELRRE